MKLFCKTCGGKERTGEFAYICMKAKHDFVDMTEGTQGMIKRGYLN